MKQIEFFDIPSPCIGVCESGPRGYCRGCYRSREERQYWYQLEDPVKRQIIRACQIRRYRHQLAQKPGTADADTCIQPDLFGDGPDCPIS